MSPAKNEEIFRQLAELRRNIERIERRIAAEAREGRARRSARAVSKVGRARRSARAAKVKRS